MTSSPASNRPIGRNVVAISLAMLLMLTALPCLAQQDLPRAAPEAVGISSARLKRIGEAIQRHIDAKHISGAVTLVARRGFVVHFEAHGLKDVASMAPMTRDTIFRMASSSKPVTGAAIMILVEEGKVRLSDPVSRFIPEFKEMKVAEQRMMSTEVELVKAKREITIRDLLTHTSGLLSGGPGTQKAPRDLMWPKGEDTLATHVPKLAQAPLDFQPGTKWRYSGLAGIDTLGRVVEVASGQTFDEFLRKRIFEPLGMSDTFFNVPDDRQDRVATIYRSTPKGLEKNQTQLRFPKTYFSGAGGLASTAADYYRFGQMLLTGRRLDGKTLLSPRSLIIYSSNHVGDMFHDQLGRGEGMGFGLTVEIVEDAIEAGTYRSNGSFGWDGAFGTHFWVDPEEQLVAVLMIQTSVGRPIHRDFETAVMQAIVE
ncbi:MAG: serine hydrolase domain-containing protein [Isosphaeraceae bacterium]